MGYIKCLFSGCFFLESLPDISKCNIDNLELLVGLFNALYVKIKISNENYFNDNFRFLNISNI